MDTLNGEPSVPPPPPLELPTDNPSGNSIAAFFHQFFRRRGVRSFFSVTGGSVFYVLSAMCVLYGIGRIFGTLLAEGSGYREAMPGLLALNFYELALVGVLLVIVLWRHVMDDAVSLVVLIAFFLVAGALSIGSFANRGVEIAMTAGVLYLCLGIAQIVALRFLIGIPLERAGFGGICLVIGWCALSSPTLAAYFGGEVAMVSSDREPWLWSWIPLLAGAAACLVGATGHKDRSPAQGGAHVPFLKSPAMGSLFAVILLTAAGVYAYTLAYMYNMARTFGDFLPLMTIVIFLLLELHRALQSPDPFVEAMICGSPLVLWILALQVDGVLATGSAGPGILLYPPVCLLLTSAHVLWLARRYQRRFLYVVVFLYILGVLFTLGYVPGYAESLNWRLAGAALAATLFAWGLRKGEMAACMTAIGLAAIGAATSDSLLEIAARHRLTWFGLGTGLGGAGLVMLTLLCGERVPRPAMFAGSILLVGFGLDFLPSAPPAPALLFALTIVSLGLALYTRTRDVVLTGLLAPVVLLALHSGTAALASWRFIVAGFSLLFFGAIVSLVKGRRTE